MNKGDEGVVASGGVYGWCWYSAPNWLVLKSEKHTMLFHVRALTLWMGAESARKAVSEASALGFYGDEEGMAKAAEAIIEDAAKARQKNK